MVRVENEAHSSHRSPKIRAKRLLNTSELGKKRGARNREKEEKERRDGSKTRRVVEQNSIRWFTIIGAGMYPRRV